MGLISQAADRILNTTAAAPPPVRPEVLAFHRSLPVVDLLVGTVLFRRSFMRRLGHGHVDLPRLREGGVDLIGLSIATRFPDLRGTLSAPHFRSLGMPRKALGSGMAIAEWLVQRIEGWAAASAGGLKVVRDAAGLEGRPRADGSVGAFIGVQGGHVLDGDARNVERLHALGVRMLAPAHVMDNELVGSGTGARAGGLTPFGREVVAECERLGIAVDLAHMSSAGIRDTVPLLRRPFLLSHTGLRSLAGGRSRWRRYSPATRNVGDDDLRLVAEAGGVVGLTLSTQLLGGSSMETLVRAFARAIELMGPERVAIGSDFDGALRMPFDVTGLPALTQALLDAGFGSEVVAGVMGGNALRQLRAARP
ncbi:MAG TPA: membrane dipeptidase [Candidatus Limnocylindrales bacterium]|nr:membrane dipeptidase [Candidatus Limnocylindrales bacterium]